MKCSKCGSNSMIYLNKPNCTSGAVYRRRKCTNCGEKWTTVELRKTDIEEIYKQIASSAINLRNISKGV